VHTNLVARDWRTLARFYERVFGCEPIPPERTLSGRWLEAGTGVPGAQIRGIHLRLPGHGDGGPTLEVFQYDPQAHTPEPSANRPGLGHIAFAVEDVEKARQQVLAEGGRSVGEVISQEIPNVGTITFAYVRDPEGNIIELQKLST
jgi:catechol 2,3-dioxygenase-like lactoylglutathione lyase family enzyme